MAEPNKAMAEQLLLCSDKLSAHFLIVISRTGMETFSGPYCISP